MAATKIPDVYYRQFADIYALKHRVNQYVKFTRNQFGNVHEYSVVNPLATLERLPH